MSDTPRSPQVVLIGGYLTEPILYRRVRDRLLQRGAGAVTIAPLRTPDWLIAALVGFGPAMLRASRAIHSARRASPDPLIVVGHSAGGIVARLAMSPVPFDGRLSDVSADIGCLVTLGTPHRLGRPLGGWRHRGVDAARFLERTTPGAWFAPTTAYLTVGSSYVPPNLPAPVNPLKRLINTGFRLVVGPSADCGSDGIVSDDQARLDGALHLELPGTLHGVFGGPWYGDAAVVDRWWPTAVDLWRGALEARAARGFERGRRSG